MMLLPLNVYLFNTLHQYWYWPLFGLLETRWHGHPSSGLTPLLCWMSSVQWSLVTWQCVTSTQTGKNCNRITRLALTSFFNYSWATQQQVRSHHILHCISASYIWYIRGKGWQCAISWSRSALQSVLASLVISIRRCSEQELLPVLPPRPDPDNYHLSSLRRVIDDATTPARNSSRNRRSIRG